jgi:hypothetical protein
MQRNEQILDGYSCGKKKSRQNVPDALHYKLLTETLKRQRGDLELKGVNLRSIKIHIQRNEVVGHNILMKRT